MEPEIIFISVSATAAVLVGIGALVAVLRGRGAARLAPVGDAEPAASAVAESGYEGMLRVAWWVAIAGILVGIGTTNAYPETRAAIFGLGGAAAALVLLVHELLPRRWRRRPVVFVEIVGGLAFASGLLLLTGHGASPFAFGYHLVAVAVALTLGSRAGLLAAAIASLAYLGVLTLDPERSAFVGADLLRIGINLGSLWLLAYLAGVYASGERRMRQRVLELSQMDPLTGLFNRGQLHPTLEQEVQRTRRSGRGFCVLMVDLDGLKAINDAMGHLRGDAVLRGLARVIRSSIRTVDSAYRYGGDEFLVLLPETEFIGAFVVAEKIREGVEAIGVSRNGEPEASASIGLVSYPEDGATAEELMLAADRAMYQAKSLGKNQVSGNPRPPRPSRQLPVGPSAIQEPAAEAALDDRQPIAVAVPSHNGAVSAGHEFAAQIHDESEPDPSDVRRQIAAARLNMDPDHQIRRAMDAFLSAPARSEGA
ncbi:MAG: GGDEF domain-containing protein [Chloroflexota bacterium]